MKIKISMMVFGLLFLQISYSSDSDSSDLQTTVFYDVSSPGTKKSLTKEQIRISREQQVAAMADQTQVVEIGTGDALNSEMNQLFIYHHRKHKGVDLGVFYEKHREGIVETLKQAAQVDSRLPSSIERWVHNELKKNMELSEFNNALISRDIAAQPKKGGPYRVLGANVPSTFKVEEEEFKDAIFNITQAREIVLASVKQHIDGNLTAARAACAPPAEFQQSTSSKVLRMPCCGSMLHEGCFASCKKYKVSSCLNSQCKTAENGKKYPTTWNEEFYNTVLSSAAMARKEIPNGSECSVCTGPLKRNIVEVALTTSRSTSKKVKPILAAGSFPVDSLRWKRK